MPKIVEFNKNDVDFAQLLTALINKDNIIVLTSNKNVDVGFEYDEGTHQERAELIICYLRKRPDLLEKIKKEFGLYGLTE